MTAKKQPELTASDIDTSHPAVDPDPRAGTTDVMNRIDFNDPRKSGREVVEEQIAAAKAASAE